MITVLLFIVAANCVSTGMSVGFLKYQLGNDWTTGDLRPKSAISDEVAHHGNLFHYIVGLFHGPSLKFGGQSNEDKNAYFKFFNAAYYKSHGVILESGGLDGELFCNSKFFVRHLGWKAIHIEGSPTNYQKLIQNRPESLNINAALCENKATLHWVKNDQHSPVSGFYEFMSPTFRKYWHAGWNDSNIHRAPTD